MKQLIIFVFILITFKVWADDYPKYFSSDKEIQFTDSNALYFNFHNVNFLWNNEFFNDVVEGYTLIGYHVTPTLQYHFNKNISVEAGIHLLQYSGLHKYSNAEPVYRVRYKKKDFTFVMGTLYGTTNHGLPDPIFFFERYFTDYLESGAQAIWNKNRLKAEIWLDWRNFIFLNDSTQEKLTAGISIRSIALKTDNWELSIPASLLLNHRGGQIDTSSNHMLTAMNYAIGLGLKRSFNYRFLTSIEGELQYMGFADNSPTVESIYENGNGYLANLRIRQKNMFLQFGYWYANEFLSLHGHPMYQCYSVKGEGYHQLERNLFTTKLYYSKQLYKGICIGLMGETFYDVKTGDFDFTTGVALLIKQNFFIARIKEKNQL